MSKYDITEMVWLYVHKKLSYSEIAKKLGCGHCSVQRCLKANGVIPRTISEARKGKYSGINSAWFGRLHTEETKRKISKANKGKLTGSNNPMYGRDHSGSKNPMYGSHRTGASNPNWRGGVSFLPWSSDFTVEKKLQIKRRDDFTCRHPEQNCRGRLTVHHIDYNKRNSKNGNLITLCQRHNGTVNKNRKYWTQYFTDKLIRYSIVPSVV